MQRSFVNQLVKRFTASDPLIHVIMGPRQVGKTTGILQFLEEYTGTYHYASADGKLTSDYAWLTEQWQATLLKGSDALLVIDEVQKIENWAELIKKLWDDQKIKKTRLRLILSVSSSLSLELGITESLAGRLEIIQVAHWDYCETKILAQLSLNDYLKYGGYPKSYEFLSDEARWYQYLQQAIINRVIDKDILQYAHVEKPALFKQAFEIICCYPAQEISYRKLLGQIQDKGNVELIKRYLELFESAFLIKTLQKYHNQAITVKSSSPKIILLAPCLYTLASIKEEKSAFIFESTVGAKLLQLSDKLYYWRDNNDEVDFVLVWRGRLFAVEVKSGRKRRANGLQKFQSRFPQAICIIISVDNYDIFIENPADFLEKLI